MTLRKLSKLYYINKLIERENSKIESLRARLLPGSAMGDGMPRNPNAKNKFEEMIPVIVDTEKRLSEIKSEYEREKAVIESWINAIDDYQVRLIFVLRFVDLLTWQQVADKVGGNNTEDSVKKVCYRYLKKTKTCPTCPDTV